MSSPASSVNDAVMTFLLKNAEENSTLKKDMEVDRLQAENDRLKRERAEKMQQDNIINLRSSIYNAFGKSKPKKY